jgi:hypothetical protein
MESIIYLTECIISGSLYVGKHTGKYAKTDGYLGSGVVLLNEIKQHGRSNFVRSTLFNSNGEFDIYAVEAFFIASVDNMFGSLLTNIQLGGQGGWLHINSNKDKYFTPERISNLSKTGKDNWHKLEGKMSPSLHNKSYTYAMHSEAMSGSGNPAARSIAAVNPNGEITIFDTMKECVSLLGVGATRLREYVNGNGPTNHKNSRWSGWRFYYSDSN